MSQWNLFRNGWLALAIFAWAIVAANTQAFPGAEQKATLEVAVDRTAYEPGSAVRVAARVTIEDHWHVNSNTPTFDYLIPTELSFELPDGATLSNITYPADQLFTFSEEQIAVYGGTVTILAELNLPADAAAGALELQASLLYQACDDKQCLPPVTAKTPFQLTVGSGGQIANAAWFEPQPNTGTPAAATRAGSANLAGMLLLALLGGLILNAMPCVLPVLSLKVFALVKSAGQGRSHLLMGTLATTAGIVASFWALALAAVLAAKAGAAVGWGIQFQQPGFVAFLAVAMLLFALNMWGLFEIPLPQSLAQAAGSSPREGLAGHFASGLFATLMATPCSAPFLGTAIGFALVQPTPVIFAIFTAVGLGLALPYLLLAAVPSAAKLLPRPGAWMITFKHLMGFLLTAAAVWLFYVLAAQIAPESVAYVQLAMIALALATWLFRHYEGRPGRRRVAAVGIAAAALASITLATTAPPAASSSTTASELIGWVSFDEDEANRLANDGKLVFVDFTADWCLTCKANEAAALNTAATRGVVQANGVATLVADKTQPAPEADELLERLGNKGGSIPFYAIFPAGNPNEPIVLDGLFTSPQPIVDALQKAGPSRTVAQQANAGSTRRAANL